MSASSLTAKYDTLQIPTSIDYSSKDFTGFMASMLAYASQAFPEWNTTSEGDFGLMLTELFAYGLDILSYYGDRIAHEAYLPTATQRLSILNIAQTLGYIPSNGSPASGFVTFITYNPGTDILVPAWTQVIAADTGVSGESPVTYETTASVSVPGNGGTATAEVLQGVTKTMVPIGKSDGSLGQSFVLPELDLIDGATQVFIQTSTRSEAWTHVDFLIDSTADAKVYSLTV